MGTKKIKNKEEGEETVRQRKTTGQTKNKIVEEKTNEINPKISKDDQAKNIESSPAKGEVKKDAKPVKPKKENKSKKSEKQRKAAAQKTQKRERRQERQNERKKKSSNSAYNSILSAIRLWCRRHYIIVVCSISTVLLLGALFLASDALEKQETKRTKQPDVTDKVTMKISIENGETDDLVIGLYGNDCPLTVKNFINLATHAKGYGYNGSKFFMSFPEALMMGGDIVHNNGTSGRSAIDEPFEEENMKIRHTVVGNIGMMGLKNNKDSKKSSQFYISFSVKASMYDGMTTVFGRVLEGFEFLAHIAKVSVGNDMKPAKQITVISSTHEKLSVSI